MQQQLRLGQREQCYVLFKNLRSSALVSAHLPNALPTQRLENHRVSHQYQVTHRDLSYKAVLFSSATIPRDTLNCAKRFAVKGPDEGLFGKDPEPPPPEIHNLTAPPSDPGDPNKAGIFNA